VGQFSRRRRGGWKHDVGDDSPSNLSCSRLVPGDSRRGDHFRLDLSLPYEALPFDMCLPPMREWNDCERGNGDSRRLDNFKFFSEDQRSTSKEKGGFPFLKVDYYEDSPFSTAPIH